MTQGTTFHLKDASTSHPAMVYYGHLLVDAERTMNSQAERSETLALTWITGECLARGGRTHIIDVDGLNHKGQPLGSWQIKIRIFHRKKQEIEVFRRDFLAREGRIVTELAAPFIQPDSPNDLDAFCTFQLAQYCLREKLNRNMFILRDCEGHEAHISIARKRDLHIREKLRHLSSGLGRFLLPSARAAFKSSAE